MVRIGVSRRTGPDCPRYSLRESALWYPEIPDDTIHIDETWFPARGNASRMFDPLVWLHFGGPRGKQLHHLIGMTIRMTDLDCVIKVPCEISFHYDLATDTADVSKTCVLGQQYRYEEEDLPNDCYSHFPIDGSGGERIDRIDINYDYKENTGPLIRGYPCAIRWMKVTTNKNRSCGFGVPSIPRWMRERVKEVSLEAPPQMAITGLYSNHVSWAARVVFPLFG